MKILENIAKRICRKLTKVQVTNIIIILQNLLEDPTTVFNSPEPELPNYRKFKVDPEVPFKKEPDSESKLDYRKIIKANNISPINYRGNNKPQKNIQCPCCGASYGYIYINNGHKKTVQYKCKVCYCKIQINNNCL